MSLKFEGQEATQLIEDPRPKSIPEPLLKMVSSFIVFIIPVVCGWTVITLDITYCAVGLNGLNIRTCESIVHRAKELHVPERC